MGTLDYKTHKILEAYKYLVHNIRHDLVHFKLLQRECEKLILHIEETLNVYRGMIAGLVNDYENRLSDGENIEVE